MPVQVSEDQVARAICSFPCGSAGGPDALRPQHLKDISSGGWQILLQSVTFFVNCVLRGETAAPARVSFFGATLIALNKKGGGLRPITVECTLRRLVVKCTGAGVKEAMGALLAPRQLGFSVPLGAEAAVHASRIFLHNLQPGHLILKLDFRNAVFIGIRGSLL